MNWYLKVLNQYADFSGRARRKEYWMFFLFNMIFAIVAMILDNVLGLTLGELPYGLFYFLYLIIVFIPGIAVAVRRLHDTGQSGWMIFVSLIPLIGAIWLLILMLTDSESGDNEYGPNPKENKDSETSIDNYSSKNEGVTGDIIIIICVAWMFLSRFIFSVLPKFMDDFHSIFSKDWFLYINVLIGLIWSSVPLALAFTVKKKSNQTTLFILGGIYLLYGLYETIINIIEY